MSDTVAVVIPTLNAAATLDRCLNSVVSQTWRPDEIVVVVGLSKDGTWSVLGKWIGEVRVLVSRPRGIGNARNLGISMTDAKYVISLDADDWIEPTYVERCLESMADGVGIVATSLMWPDGTVQHPKEPVTAEHLSRENCIFGASMFRRSAWDSVGGYDENPRTYEDWCLWRMITMAGWAVAIIDEPLFHYCPAADCSSARMKPGDHEEYCRRVIEKHLKSA
jgi:glycosyltransferase involved in cell wall biosynthesis